MRDLLREGVKAIMQFWWVRAQKTSTGAQCPSTAKMPCCSRAWRCSQHAFSRGSSSPWLCCWQVRKLVPCCGKSGIAGTGVLLCPA